MSMDSSLYKCIMILFSYACLNRVCWSCDPGIVYYRNKIHFPEESDDPYKPFTEQYDPKSYLKNTIQFPEENDPVADILFYE